MIRKVKIVISKQDGGYVGYPLGLEGIVVGEGDTYEEALKDVESAIKFHIQTFGKKVIKGIDVPQEAFIAETEIKV